MAVWMDGLHVWYRVTQRQADLFWQWWRSKYLSMLQKLAPRANIRPNTFVLLYDHAAPRDHWSKGVVTFMIYDCDEVCRQVVLRTPNGKECICNIKKLFFLSAIFSLVIGIY